VRLIAAGAENDVTARGVSVGVKRIGRLGRALVGVNPHARKIVAEARLEDLARFLIERFSRRLQYLVYSGRRRLWLCCLQSLKPWRHSFARALTRMAGLVLTFGLIVSLWQ
jgi:hypothetical protein